jgi:hypothetical protein
MFATHQLFVRAQHCCAPTHLSHCFFKLVLAIPMAELVLQGGSQKACVVSFSLIVNGISIYAVLY